MERFVFVSAIVVAVVFALGLTFGNSNGWHLEFGDGDGGGAPAALVELSSGRVEAAAFSGESLRIRHTVAHIAIIPEDRADYLIEIENPGGAPMPTVSASDGRVTIDGHLRGRIIRCTEGGAELRGYEAVTSESRPRIAIRAPRTLNLRVGGANTTEIAAAEAVDLDHTGCGVANLGDVAGPLAVDVAGSGQVNAGDVGSLDVDLAGSGGLSVGAVSGEAKADVAGSGRVAIASLTGALNVDSAGSGGVNVRAGAVTDASINLAGSGGVTIAAPVQRLNVSIVGSGDVVVEGDVGDLDAEVAGSGGVRAWAVTGRLNQRAFGSGRVEIRR